MPTGLCPIKLIARRFRAKGTAELGPRGALGGEIGAMRLVCSFRISVGRQQAWGGRSASVAPIPWHRNRARLGAVRGVLRQPPGRPGRARPGCTSSTQRGCGNSRFRAAGRMWLSSRQRSLGAQLAPAPPATASASARFLLRAPCDGGRIQTQSAHRGWGGAQIPSTHPPQGGCPRVAEGTLPRHRGPLDHRNVGLEGISKPLALRRDYADQDGSDLPCGTYGPHLPWRIWARGNTPPSPEQQREGGYLGGGDPKQGVRMPGFALVSPSCHAGGT